ncbi:carboxypeptidase M32 [Planctomycetota bacterium]|nr:carboxypeptidase M32 [Planctomycetota bacterium]
MMASGNAYEQLISKHREMNTLQTISWGLNWDQDVMMPPKGLKSRARELEYLAGLIHDMVIDEEIGELLDACESDESVIGDRLSVSAVNVREIRRGYDMAVKLPSQLVKDLTSASSLARAAWADAKKNNDFKGFAPQLEKLVALLREKADCLGGGEDGGEKWDALAEEYEPGCKARDVEAVFKPLRERLVDLVGRLAESSYQPKDVVNHVEVDFDQQLSFAKVIAGKIGFDFEGGRLDTSSHPFCSGFGYGDCRMTTRIHKNKMPDALSSTMHESGHGMYTQGTLEEHAGTPMGSYVSLGIHESQSRLWENQVGRSEAFWKWCMPLMHEHFGEKFAGVHARDVYESLNIVERSLIRTQADEVTYNLHIMIRFELELALVRGDLNVADLPGAWNEKYKDYLGIDVPDDGVGCLQDIHWSLGAIGYFPTYTLGNLYSAQFYEKANQELGDLHAMFEQGDFTTLLGWLRKNIHEHGMRYRAGELCEVVTGEKLKADALLRHLEGKYGEVYKL